MFIFSMKLSLIFSILFILGSVLSMPYEEEGAGDDTQTQAFDVNQTPTEGMPINGDEPAAEVTPVVEDQTPEEVLPVEDQTSAEGVLHEQEHQSGRKCRFSTYRRGNRDPCGLRAYERFCSRKGPCAYNGYNGYLPVIGNPYYFVQCGSGGISHCQPCAPGTKWSQYLLTCVHANSR